MTETGSLDLSRSSTFLIGGDLKVRRLGFGAMRITGKGVWGPPEDRDEAIRVLRRAIELGIDFIDTADSYGPFVSEELIAEALHPYPPGLVIATKAGFERSGPGEWQENGKPEHLRRAIEGSLRRLRLERIDLYQLHRIDANVPADQQFETMAALQSEGKIRHIGLSEVGVKEIDEAAEYFSVTSVQNRYNVQDREWESVVDYCEHEGIAFIPWYPLAQGKVKSQKVIEGIARVHGATPTQVALAWLLARSEVILPIPGTSRVPHLEENAAAAALKLNEEDLRELVACIG
ncbi:MAG: aldo/keto reductase [Acidobacteriota bacterium]